MTAATERRIGGLDAGTIARMSDVFARVPEIEQVILYGSRALGTQRTGSDIDLALVGKELSLDHLLRVNCLLDDLSLPYTIDLHLLRNVENPALLAHIERAGMAIYARKPVTATPSGAAIREP